MSGSVAKKIRSVCVFCGSSLGNDPQYAKEAEALGKELAKNGIKLVYGGGRAGLMGIVADSWVSLGHSTSFLPI